MLRADPPLGSTSSSDTRDSTSALARDSKEPISGGGGPHFPPSAFNFSFPGTAYDLFDLPPAGVSDKDGMGAHSVLLSAGGGSMGMGGSAAPEGPLDYAQIMGFLYNSGGPGSFSDVSQQMGQHQPQPQPQFTHVDPTQILGGPYTRPSPSSDGWAAGGFTSSSTASPEPFTQSPAEGQQQPQANSNANARKIQGTKRAQQAAAAPKRRQSGTLAGVAEDSTNSSKPLATSTEGEGVTPGVDLEEDGTPTVCSNCATTNTPLWRRDPEGNPLCA